MMAKSKMAEDAVSTTEYLTKISDNSTRMMEAMDDIVWSIDPLNDDMAKTVARMREFANEILEARDIEVDFCVEEEVDEAFLNMQERRDFFLIYKEAINNAAKYANCSKVTIALRYKASIMSLSINDDGAGFVVAEAESGNGLNNMQKRAANLGGSLVITSSPGAGTTVLLQFKIT
jgi:signal transduction histidine kinase